MIDSLLKNEGLTKTDLYCHNCSKNFVAEIDYSINGNHEIYCPTCGHTHFRVITDGKVTADRYDSSLGDGVKCMKTWKHQTLNISTSTISLFLRDKWLNKGY